MLFKNVDVNNMASAGTPVMEGLEDRLCLSAPSRHHAAAAHRSSHKAVVAPARHSRSSRHHRTTIIGNTGPVFPGINGNFNGNTLNSGGGFAVNNTSFAAGGATGLTPLTTVGSPLTTTTFDPITGQATGVPTFSLNNGLNSNGDFFTFDPVTGLPTRVNSPFASSLNLGSTLNANGGFSGQTPILGTDGTILNNSGLGGSVITAGGFTQNGVNLFNNQGVKFAAANNTASNVGMIF
jgi:hypothetical protein